MTISNPRYQHDPNPRVRDAMVHIWRALVDEPKKTVDENLPAILDELLRELGSRLWRNREACCTALSDLLQVGAAGRPTGALVGRRCMGSQHLGNPRLAGASAHRSMSQGPHRMAECFSMKPECFAMSPTTAMCRGVGGLR
jgi:hypothetical protein